MATLSTSSAYHEATRVPASRPKAPQGWWIAVGVAVCAAAASLLGLLVDGVYVEDPATAEMMRGYDAVTLAVVVPCLAVALAAARRRPRSGRLAMATLLMYLGYTYAYYVFGTGFNDLLLLHAAVFAGSFAGLGLTLLSCGASDMAAGFSPRTPVRTVASVLGALAAGLAVMWVYASVAYAVTGDVPAGSALVENESVVHLGIVLDLTLLVPLYAMAAVLLWRRREWGYVLATVALVAGSLHQVSYLVALLFQDTAGVPGAVAFDPLEPVILLLYAGAAIALLLGRSGRPAPTQGR